MSVEQLRRKLGNQRAAVLESDAELERFLSWAELTQGVSPEEVGSVWATAELSPPVPGWSDWARKDRERIQDAVRTLRNLVDCYLNDLITEAA